MLEPKDESQVGPDIAELLDDAVFYAVAYHRPVPAAAKVIDLGCVVGELQVEDGIGLGLPEEECGLKAFDIGHLLAGLHFLDEGG